MNTLLISAIALLTASASSVLENNTAVVSNLSLAHQGELVANQRAELKDPNSDCRYYGTVRKIGDTSIQGGQFQFFDISVTQKVCGNTETTVSLRSSHFEMPIPANYEFKLYPESSPE